jgi:hypothetical protein
MQPFRSLHQIISKIKDRLFPKPLNPKPMSNYTGNEVSIRNGFIIELTDATSESMSDIPKNRTILVLQLTKSAASKPEIAYSLETVEEVFRHFKPGCEVVFVNERGESIKETLRFKNLSDFGKKGIISQSPFLNQLAEAILSHQSFARKLGSNKTLQKLLADPTKKEAYLTALQILLDELEEKVLLDEQAERKSLNGQK